MIRTIFSVLAGFALWSVLWLSLNAALTAALPGTFREDGSTESAPILLAILALSVVFSVLAGYVTAAIARAKAFPAAWILGLLHLTIGLVVQGMAWTTLPVWYHLGFLAFLVPGILLGAKLRVDRPPRVRLA